MDSSDQSSLEELVPISLENLEEGENQDADRSISDPEIEPEIIPTERAHGTLSTQTQEETTGSKSCGFKKIPQLTDMFRLVGWDGNRNKLVACKNCPYTVASNREERLLTHIKTKCPNISEAAKTAFLNSVVREVDARHLSLNEQLNMLIAEIIVRNNVPFKIVECPIFIKCLKFLNSQARPASRHEMSSRYVPRLAKMVEKRFMEFLKLGRNYQLSVEFDHWSDLSGRLMIGIVATQLDGSRYLVHLEDVSLRGHFSSVIIDTLKKGLCKVPTRCINSIISDSAATCRKAKRTLISEPGYKHIIIQRCMAHFFNLIGSSFCKSENIQGTMHSANRLAGFISNNQALSAKLVASGVRKVAKATAVRWYSNVSMLESLINAREELNRCLIESGDSQSQFALKMADAYFWNQIEQIIKIMRPLANCIAVAEIADGSLGEAMKAIIDFVKSLLESDWDSKYVIAALKAFFTYFNTDKLGCDEIGLMIAAYFLDRRYKMDFIALEGTELVLETVAKIAALSGLSVAKLNLLLYPEFTRFYKQESPFDKIAIEDQPALTWWTEMPDSSVLKDVALRLAALKSSSANIERVFSVIKIFQSPVRTNFSLETLENIARSKLSVGQDEDDNHLYGQLVQENLFAASDDLSNNSGSSSSQMNEEEEGEELQFSQSFDSLQHRPSSSQTYSSTPRSSEKKRRSLPTQVRLNESTASLPNFLTTEPAQDDLDVHESGLRERLGTRIYDHLRKFRTWFDFSLINEIQSDSNPIEEEPAHLQEEVDQLKNRFRADMAR